VALALLHLKVLADALAVEDVLASGYNGILSLMSAHETKIGLTASLQIRHTVPSLTFWARVLVLDLRTRSGWQAI